MSGRAPRVLVVEDMALSRKLFRDLLALEGHEVEEATSVEEARAALQASPPDLVLLDVQIPGGGGEALLAEIRADPRTAHLPVVAVTAFAMPGDRERLLERGFDDYIAKPIDTRTFVVTVERYLKPRGGGDHE